MTRMVGSWRPFPTCIWSKCVAPRRPCVSMESAGIAEVKSCPRFRHARFFRISGRRQLTGFVRFDMNVFYMDTVPRPRRHCQGAATPGSASLGPVDSPFCTMRSREVRGVALALRRRRGPAPGRGLDCSRRPFPFQRCLHMDEAGPPRFPGDHPVALRRSPTPAGPVRLARGGGPGAAPAVRKQEGTGIDCLEAQQVASPPAVHASHVAVRHATLASCWRSAPLPGGSRTRWITTKGSRSSCPPFQGLAWRKETPSRLSGGQRRWSSSFDP